MISFYISACICAFCFSLVSCGLLDKDRYVFENKSLVRVLQRPSVPLSWVRNIAEDGFLRVVTVGGSNCVFPHSFPSNLLSFMERADIMNKSYSANYAIGGTSPDFFAHCIGSNEDLVGRFETGQPPNVWVLDMSVNLPVHEAPNGLHEATAEVESLLSTIRGLYYHRRLRQPSIVFVDLWSTLSIYGGRALDYSYHTGIVVNSIAEFHDIPVVSFKLQYFKTFVNRFITDPCWKGSGGGREKHVNCRPDSYFMDDFHHLSQLAHDEILRRGLVPLLREALDVDVASLPPSEPQLEKEELALTSPSHRLEANGDMYRCFSRTNGYAPFESIVSSFGGWYISGYVGGTHKYARRCLMSKSANQVVTISIPSDKVYDAVNMFYYRSWNRSFTGDISCWLDEDKAKNVIVSGLNSRPFTEPQVVSLFDGIDKKKSKTLRCSSLDHRLACIVAVQFRPAPLSASASPS